MDPTRAAAAAVTLAVVVTPAVAGCSPSTPAGPSRPAAMSGSAATTVPAPATTVAPASVTAAPAPAPAPSTTAEAPASVKPSPAPASATTSPGCPAGLASQLASTGPARQLVTVESSSYSSTYAEVELWQKQGSCWALAGGPWTGRIGFNGFSDHHREGDGTTPTGLYGFGPVMYGLAPNPGVHEPYHVLVCGDWWDEDPTSAGYNTFQHVPCGTNPPFGGGSEALWEQTTAYQSFALVDYNTGPVVKGAGSAVFLHADVGSATAGCISLPLGELDRTLDWLQPSLDPVIVLGPSSEIDRF